MDNIKSQISCILKGRYLPKILAFALILTLTSLGWVPSAAQASEPILTTFSGQVIDDEGRPASTIIKAYLIEKGTDTVHDEPFATGTSSTETGKYVLRDTSAYGSPEIIDISGYIENYDFMYEVINVGVTGGVSKYRAYFNTSGNIVRDFQLTTHGNVNVHIKDMNGNNAPSGVPMWFSYVGPYGYNDPNWPDNAPPSDGVSPKQVTDSSGTISMRLNASWTFDGGSLGGFIYAFPAGYRNYGGALQTSALRYDWPEITDVSAHAGKTKDYFIQVKPLGQIISSLEDSRTGDVISGANISYTSADTSDTSNQHNINKYCEGNSVYALGPVTIRVNDPDNPGYNHLGHESADKTVTPIPWGQVPVTFKLDPHEPGVIAGKVYDTDEKPIAGATVELLWDELGGEGGLEGGMYKTIKQTTTGADGSYRLTDVVPTSRQGYVLRGSKTLFSATMKGNIYVSSGETTTAQGIFLCPVCSTVNINPSTFSIGQSAVVTAQVKDAVGNPVADGTKVSLATSRGLLTSGDNMGENVYVLVSHGQVTAKLSSDTKGSGTVSLNNGEAVAPFEVTSPAKDITSPTVKTITPINNQKNVALDSNIILTFDEGVQEGINFNGVKGITLSDSKGSVTIEKSLSGNILTIKPSTLRSGERYKLSIPKDSMYDMSGNKLRSAYSYTFYTVVLPVVKSTTPANGAVNVKLTSQVTVAFNIPVTAGEGFEDITLTDEANNNIKLEESLTTVGDADYQDIDYDKTINKTILTIKPLKELESRTYTVTIPYNAVKDSMGNNMVRSYSFAFTTQKDTAAPVVKSTKPSMNGKDVGINKDIIVYFNENIEEGSSFENIGITYGKTNQVFNLNKELIRIEGNKLIVPITDINNSEPPTPDKLLPTSTVCTLTIPAGAVKDTDHIPLLKAYKLTFTTTDANAPKIKSSSIKENAVNIKANSTISIIFTKNIYEGERFDNITLRDQDGNEVPVLLAINKGITLTIKPKAYLPFESSLTLTLPEGAVMDSSDKASEEDYVLHFSTEPDKISPTVVSTDPIKNAVGVPSDITEIKITFSEKIQVSNTNAITLKNSSNRIVSGAFADIKSEGNVMILTLKSPLNANSKFTITIGSGTIKDCAGIPNLFKGIYSFSFTTAKQ